MFAEISNRPARVLLLTATCIASSVAALACSGDAEPTSVVLPTATPGTISATPTPVVIQSELDGKVQVGFNFAIQDYPQQGAGVLTQLDRGTRVKITVRPAPGVIQQVSIRNGRCENANNLEQFSWVETLDPAVGGVSETDLPDRHIGTLLDGNHSIAVSIPGGTFSQVATCGDLPDTSHLEIPPQG